MDEMHLGAQKLCINLFTNLSLQSEELRSIARAFSKSTRWRTYVCKFVKRLLFDLIPGRKNLIKPKLCDGGNHESAFSLDRDILMVVDLALLCSSTTMLKGKDSGALVKT
ncbi:hypothetical protein H2248_003571 [Termitomyces sp. 'cryptogamus']|nr:hypothetical protein H2248_003571 [Termitomyces sp. 'cryptogamus']